MKGNKSYCCNLFSKTRSISFIKPILPIKHICTLLNLRDIFSNLFKSTPNKLSEWSLGLYLTSMKMSCFPVSLQGQELSSWNVGIYWQIEATDLSVFWLRLKGKSLNFENTTHSTVVLIGLTYVFIMP